MADAVSILSANGLGLAAELVQAANAEGLALPIAATVIAGESWGRNIYGHDNVPTGGTYTKGGAVTRENYLAYRSWMRGGTGRRQGVGPAQCTSSQYQDTADSLGGCHLPIPNMRSGFRGMGALMKTYGTRDGARRYNGSGPQADAYAASFMTRLAIWQGRLAGATAPATSPAPQETDMTPEESARLARIEGALAIVIQQLCGEKATITNPWPGKAGGGGWQTMRDKTEVSDRLTLVDYVRTIERGVHDLGK